MKIRVERDIMFVGVVFQLMGLLGLILIFCSPSFSWDSADIYSIIIFCGMPIIWGTLALIIGTRYYIMVEEGSVQLYRGKKLKKEILRTNIQRVLICQIMFHGKKNQYIVFDDGTFYNKKVVGKKIFSAKVRNSESWIIIEYSNSRMDIVKQSFPECPIETLGPNEY